MYDVARAISKYQATRYCSMNVWSCLHGKEMEAYVYDGAGNSHVALFTSV